MVFSTTNLLKGIRCPESGQCRLTNCVFGHESVESGQRFLPGSVATISEGNVFPASPAEPSEPAPKKRKVAYDSLVEKPPSRADMIRSQLAEQRKNAINAIKAQTPSSAENSKTNDSSVSTPRSSSTLTRSVSPPTINNRTGLAPTQVLSDGMNGKKGLDAKTNTVETLNPRLLAQDPAGHATRTLYLKHLHAQIVRLNLEVGQLPVSDKRRNRFLEEQQLIRLALDEEEAFALHQSSIYGNVVKRRIALLKRMGVDEWIKEVEAKLEPAKADDKDVMVIATGLPIDDEYLLLPHLIVPNQKELAKYGYIPTPPTAEAAEEAAAAVLASHNYETCDRCAARFQVFPERNEEGLLTSNGPCKYHPLRKVQPVRAKTDKETGPQQAHYPCCNEVVGTVGCTRTESHVFKISSPARLAAVLPFIITPENATPEKDPQGRTIRAVAFDCEMGYTSVGMEMIRLTAVSWPYAEPLIDVLVRPIGAVIDLNSRFSGVFPEHYRDAVPYAEWARGPRARNPAALPIVDSPAAARDLLCHYLTPTTPLIGHSIDNDLNVVRLCHPSIVDTVLLFAHPRGLPMRFGLKMLSQRHLRRSIQNGGERGHDSMEDAVATGDLLRVKVGDKWKLLRAQGWQLVDGRLVAPDRKTDVVGVPGGLAGDGKLGNGRVEVSKKRTSEQAFDT